MVGDALMAPYELLAANGSAYLGEDDQQPGMFWFMTLARHFERACWLNPEPAELLAGQHGRGRASGVRDVPAHGRRPGRGSRSPDQGQARAARGLVRCARPARSRCSRWRGLTLRTDFCGWPRARPPLRSQGLHAACSPECGVSRACVRSSSAKNAWSSRTDSWTRA